MSQIIALSIVRFKTLLKGSQVFLYIDDQTDEQKVKDVIIDYVNERKDSIVQDYDGVRIDGEENMWLSSREQMFERMINGVNDAISLKRMNKNWIIPDGEDEDFEVVESYVRMDLQPVVKV